jgi:tRNA pseudouridine38-40 synthase
LILEKLALQEYRIDQETETLLYDLLQEYKGSHNFHNFTIGKPFTDSSARRYMLSLSTSKPFLKSNREWISIKIHGQSFMLHQIRKMVSLVVLMIRTRTLKKLITEAYGDMRINVPKAPALGLLLERPIFQEYNRTMEDKEGRDQIDFEKFKDEIVEFKQKWIYDAINRDEEADGHFGLWLKGIDRASTDVEWYLRGEGDVCVEDRPELLFKSLKREEEGKNDTE